MSFEVNNGSSLDEDYGGSGGLMAAASTTGAPPPMAPPFEFMPGCGKISDVSVYR